MSLWYVESKDRKALGPYSTSELRDALERPDVPFRARVSAVGTKTWLPWTEVKELVNFTESGEAVAQQVEAEQPTTKPPGGGTRGLEDPGQRSRFTLYFPWVLSVLALVGLGVSASFIARQHGQLETTRYTLSDLDDRIADAEAKVAGLESERAASEEQMKAIAYQTEGIGFTRLSWSLQGITGAESLTLIARSSPNEQGCTIHGSFQVRGQIRPLIVPAKLLNRGGEVIHESKVHIAMSQFEMAAPHRCQNYSMLALGSE